MSVKKDFSEGPLFKNILIFSLPLIFTNLLQTFFNMTDIAVLGRFASSSSVGSVSPGSAVSVSAVSVGCHDEKSIAYFVHCFLVHVDYLHFIE